MKKRLMILDGLNMWMRSYIVDPSLSTNGEPIGGVKGFFKILQKLSKEVKPDYIVIVWDGAGGSKKRKTLHKEYKSGRAPVRLNRNIDLNEAQQQENKTWQLNRTIEYLNLTPVVQLIEDGVEADDIISFVSNMERFSGWNKVIVSSDKDFYQLCDDETIVYRPVQEQVLNKNKIVEEFGIHPLNFALARAMAGDPSDNLSGLRGVGLGTISKRIPFLKESKEYEIKDVVDFCKEQRKESKLKFFDTVAEGEEVIQFNYKMMQLYNPQLSYRAKKRVEFIFENSFNSFSHTEFVANAIHDGFGQVNFESLFALFRRIALENR